MKLHQEDIRLDWGMLGKMRLDYVGKMRLH